MPLHFAHGIVRVIVGRKELIEKEYECKVKKKKELMLILIGQEENWRDRFSFGIHVQRNHDKTKPH